MGKLIGLYLLSGQGWRCPDLSSLSLASSPLLMLALCSLLQHHLIPCHNLLIKQIAFYFLSPMDACVYLNLFCIYSGLFVFNGGLNACSFFIVFPFISNNKQTFDLTATNTFTLVPGIIICICQYSLFTWIFNTSLLPTIKLLFFVFSLKLGIDYALSFSSLHVFLFFVFIIFLLYIFFIIYFLLFYILVLFFFLSLLARLGGMCSPKGSQHHGPVRTVGNFFVKCTPTNSLV